LVRDRSGREQRHAKARCCGAVFRACVACAGTRDRRTEEGREDDCG
jgi:hypothetical protein